MTPTWMPDRRAILHIFVSWALVAHGWAPISLQETQGRGNLPPHPPLHTPSWLCSSSCLTTALSSELYLKVGGLVRQHCGWTWAQGKCRFTLNHCAKTCSVRGRVVALPSAVLHPGTRHVQQILVCMLEVEAQKMWTNNHGQQRRILQQEWQPHPTSWERSRNNSIVIK